MIPVHNIYYMLAYAFKILKEDGYNNIETEEFKNTADFCAAILIKGVSSQLKHGLGREYVSKEEVISGIKGKINITKSIKNLSILNQKLLCIYDDFSIDTYKNRIIKSTLLKLLHAEIEKTRKKEIRKLLIYFEEVEEIDIYTINWKQHYTKNNKTYELLISICYLIVKGLIHTTYDGSTKLMTFLDEQRMCRLYEKFILEYYRKEHPEIHTNASQIDWQLDDEMDHLLPKMQSDITLSKGNKVLIIDAKYYQSTLQTQFDVKSIHSGNLYQIFTYVKNKDFELKDNNTEVAGMLLYAKTDEEIQPNQKYRMSGNTIYIKTLDLNLKFDQIKNQLDQILVDYFKN